jgi:UDP-N-acetylglucosamine:LPS N-acetylglucosamine transferase
LNDRSSNPAELSAPPAAATAAVIAIDMGYGHLRPARTLAQHLGTAVLHADRPPLADVEEQRHWAAIRRFYETTTRASSLRWAGPPFRSLLNIVTDIPPLYPFRDLSSPTLGVKWLERLAKKGLGRSMVAHLQERALDLVTTFYSPAVLADYHGYDRIFCVVTDSDVNRVWAPIAPRTSKVHYFAPSGRVVRRLRACGMPKEQVELTGFPLPHSLVGSNDAALRQNLAARLARLDPERIFRQQFAADLEAFDPIPEPSGPPHLVFAVGGAGAQAGLPALFLPSLRNLLESGQLRLTLVAGVRPEVARVFETQIAAAGLASERGRTIDILFETELDRYFDSFDALLGTADILWTKPSELVFYAALGLPLLLSDPIGIHESYNLRWVRENGAGFKQRNPLVTGERLLDLLADGLLAGAAWAGYKRLPHRGLYQIVDRLRRDRSAAATA